MLMPVLALPELLSGSTVDGVSASWILIVVIALVVAVLVVFVGKLALMSFIERQMFSPSKEPGEGAVVRLILRLWWGWKNVVAAGRLRPWHFAVTGVSAGAGVVLVMLVLVSGGLSVSPWWIRISVVAVALLTLAASLRLMLTWYVRHKATPDDRFPLLAAIVLSAVVTGLSVVAFAGLADLFWMAGYAAPPNGRGAPAPSYAAVLGSYLWNLVAAVPLLAIPRRLGWEDPQPLNGAAASAALLAFKIVLIAPLVRVAQAIYGAVEQRWLKARERQGATLDLISNDLTNWNQWSTPPPAVGPQRRRHASTMMGDDRRRRYNYRDRAEVKIRVQVVMAGLSVAAVIAAWDADLLAAYLPGNAGATVGPVLVASLPWVVAVWLAARSVLTIPRRAATLMGTTPARTALICVAWVVQLTSAAAAAISLLLRGGSASISPSPVSGGTDPLVVLEILAWQLCDALPGPDIPATLQWAQPGTFTGTPAALTELLLLAGVVVLLAFPAARAFRAWSKDATDDWEQIDDEAMAEDQPPQPALVQDAVAEIGKADNAWHTLVALAQRDNRTIAMYASYPWSQTPAGGRRLRRVGAHRRGLQAHLDAAIEMEEALERLRKMETSLKAGLVQHSVIRAFDAAASAQRRRYLYFCEEVHTGSTPRNDEALAWLGQQAADKLQQFTAVADALERRAKPAVQAHPASVQDGKDTNDISSAL